MAKKNADSFEALFKETEALVERLESGELTLDESIAEYERAITNLYKCDKLLGAAREKVKVLIEENERSFRLANLDTDALEDTDESEDDPEDEDMDEDDRQ